MRPSLQGTVPFHDPKSIADHDAKNTAVMTPPVLNVTTPKSLLRARVLERTICVSTGPVFIPHGQPTEWRTHGLPIG